MLNPFRRRPRFDDAAKQTLIEGLAFMLEAQKACAGSHPIESESGHVNHKALGYIYGFVHSALVVLGQDDTDAAVCVPVLYHVLRHLYPGREEQYIKFLAENMGHDQDVTLGAMKGGQQYTDFVAKRRRDSGMAMGLARYLIEGDQPE